MKLIRIHLFYNKRETKTLVKILIKGCGWKWWATKWECEGFTIAFIIVMPSLFSTTLREESRRYYSKINEQNKRRCHFSSKKKCVACKKSPEGAYLRAAGRKLARWRRLMVEPSQLARFKSRPWLYAFLLASALGVFTVPPRQHHRVTRVPWTREVSIQLVRNERISHSAKCKTLAIETCLF